MRGQAAMEFLFTYAWALIVVLVGIGAFAYFALLNPAGSLPEGCMASAGFDCSEFLVEKSGGQVELLVFVKPSVSGIKDLSLVALIDGQSLPCTAPDTIAAGAKGRVNCSGTLAVDEYERVLLEGSYTPSGKDFPRQLQLELTTKIYEKEAPPDPCGNGSCDVGETCTSCPSDCGVCPPVCAAPPDCSDGYCALGSCVLEGGSCVNECWGDAQGGDATRATCAYYSCEKTTSGTAYYCDLSDVDPTCCGNGVQDPGEGCGNCPADAISCQTCGNNNIEGTETCDDGNLLGGDGCSASCQVECGNGVIDGSEECDDGNLLGGDGCSASCQVECGNGVIDSGETCDEGASNGACPATCSSSCTTNTCSTVCGFFESPYTCSGSVIWQGSVGNNPGSCQFLCGSYSASCCLFQGGQDIDCFAYDGPRVAGGGSAAICS